MQSNKSTVSAFDAKTRLGRLLDRVETGEAIIITRHGHPVARLVPFEEKIDRKKVDRALAEIEKLARGRSLKGVSIRQLIEEGRRL